MPLEQLHTLGPGCPLTFVCVYGHTLILFSKERLVTDHIVQILSYCKASFKGEKKKSINCGLFGQNACSELLEKGIWQNEKQGMKGP